MAPGEINLEQTWVIGTRIGDDSGFGEVFEATSGGTRGAAKFIPKAPGAERELLFVNLDGAKNVIPILDSGETDDAWVLVMPRAEKSLRAHLKASGGALSLTDAISVLDDVAVALDSLADQVVHRDVKPENILLLDDAWCLADFGISRYAEATTGDETRKFMMTPPYAAPEQWRYEHATSATDIYALGVVAFELVSGARPFSGPDFRDQHLHSEPSALEDVPIPFGSLIEECLYKSAGARPSASVFLDRLRRVTPREATGGLAALHQANQVQVSQRAESERKASLAQTAAERRQELVEAATKSLVRISIDLRKVILEAAPTAISTAGLYDDRPEWELTLGEAQLGIHTVEASPPGAVSSFDVICHSMISLRMPSHSHGYAGRGHSLWFCDAVNEGEFAWFETAFMQSGVVGGRPPVTPFAQAPAQANAALEPVMGTMQVAWPFTRLNPGDVEDFIDRWGGWLGSAAQGSLSYPMRLPEGNPSGSWRR
ncbi:MAG: hypothetical protein QOI31_2155 [Solirubrobacterales bacterium]|jgi:serine/threonine-protein kinase|nr:hypothetical protein [Solirubrobacterales bacterium]